MYAQNDVLRTENFIIDSIIHFQNYYGKTQNLDTSIVIGKDSYSKFTFKKNKHSRICCFHWDIQDYEQRIECFIFNGELKKITVSSIKYSDFKFQYYFRDNEIVAYRYSPICRLYVPNELEEFKKGELINYRYILRNVFSEFN